MWQVVIGDVLIVILQAPTDTSSSTTSSLNTFRRKDTAVSIVQSFAVPEVLFAPMYQDNISNRNLFIENKADCIFFQVK